MTAVADKRQRGHFWMNGQKGGKKRYRVVVEQRPQIGEEILVRRRDGSHDTVVVTGDVKQFKDSGQFHARFADLGTDIAEKARARKKAPRKPRPAPPPPAPYEAKRPRGCVGGMTLEQARREARMRGPGWQPYECAKCAQHHIEET